MYYVRRHGRIKGPLTREKLRSLRRERRLRMRDEVSQTPDGPWRTLRDVRGEVLDGDQSPLSDREAWSDEPELMPPEGDDGAIDGAPDREWHETVHNWLEGEDPFRKPFRPWMYLLEIAVITALAILVLAVVFGKH